jgi:hypothetical protein
MGYMLASIAFDSSIDRAQANHLVSIAEALSYRQLCVIRFFGTKSDFELRDDDYPSPRPLSLQSVMQEIWELYTRGLITLPSGFLINFSDLRPNNVKMMTPVGLGVKLHNLMELWKLPRSDLQDLEKLLYQGD